MAKTLQITSIIAAILAIVLFVLPVVFGVRSDEQVEQFLNSTDVIEKFNKAKGDSDKRSENQISPLVKQAEAFALYLNPPAKPTPKKTPATYESPILPRPTVVSAKFTLIGTSYYALHPELSLALIDEPGKGLRWVRQSSEVGHLVIEQVKDGLVVVRDGQRTFELVTMRPEERSLLKGHSSGGKAGSKFTLSAPAKATAGITDTMPRQISAEENALTKKFIGKMKAVRAEVEAGKIDSERSIKENEALMEELLSKLETMRISNEEAKRLGYLGQKLKDVREDASRAKGPIDKVEESSREPNNPAKK